MTITSIIFMELHIILYEVICMANKFKEENKMAVFCKPKAIVPVLSEKSSKAILKTEANKKLIIKMINTSEKFRGRVKKG